MHAKAMVTAGTVVLSLGLSGCGTVSSKFLRLAGWRPAPALELRAASQGDDIVQTPSSADRLYAGASIAIHKRDYGTALEILQLAKQRTPDDVRVLNALGVVYDKLGRFDLSDRYYHLAAAADPTSPIVTANLRYSSVLRTESVALTEQASIPTAPVVAVAPTRSLALVAPPPAMKLTLAQAAAPPRKVTSGLSGGPLIVVNASGRTGAQEPVRQYLASAGWTVRTRLEIRPLQATSEVRFAERHRDLAEALARTLPFRASLLACANGCSGLELIVGANAKVAGPYGAIRGAS